MSKPTAFPLDESKLPFEIPKDAVLREKIVKLGQMITDRIPAKNRRRTPKGEIRWKTEVQTRGTRHTRNCSGRCRVHPLHGCMQIAQHQQLNVKEHACGARNPILQTGWDISLQQRRNHELPRIQLQ